MDCVQVRLMVATTWVVPSGVFFTSIIGWQYFVGKRSVPADKCYVQYMDSAVFNCLLQVGYFWATLVVMCALYAGIYRVALRLHRESVTRRLNMAAATAPNPSTTRRYLGPVPLSAASSSGRVVYQLVATETVSCAHAHRDDADQCRADVLSGDMSDLSLSEHDVTPRRHDDANDVTSLLPPPARDASAETGIELQELTIRGPSTITAMTFSIHDDDIRFVDDVTDEDDEVFDRHVTSSSGNDANPHHHHHHHQRRHYRQQSDLVSSRDRATGSRLLSASEERERCRHSAECCEPARVDTSGVPARRRFCGHVFWSSRRRQWRSRSTTTCDWHSGSQVNK